MISENDKYFVSSQFTYADIYIYYIVYDLLQTHIPKFDIEKYPKIK